MWGGWHLYKTDYRRPHTARAAVQVHAKFCRLCVFSKTACSLHTRGGGTRYRSRARCPVPA